MKVYSIFSYGFVDGLAIPSSKSAFLCSCVVPREVTSRYLGCIHQPAQSCSGRQFVPRVASATREGYKFFFQLFLLYLSWYFTLVGFQGVRIHQHTLHFFHMAWRNLFQTPTRLWSDFNRISCSQDGHASPPPTNWIHDRGPEQAPRVVDYGSGWSRTRVPWTVQGSSISIARGFVVGEQKFHRLTNTADT
jgi:hypothetical protein